MENSVLENMFQNSTVSQTTNRRIQKCGNCGQEGHNKRRCPTIESSTNIISPQVERVVSSQNNDEAIIQRERNKFLLRKDVCIENIQKKKSTNELDNKDKYICTYGVSPPSNLPASYTLWCDNQKNVGFEFLDKTLLSIRNNTPIHQQFLIAEPGSGKTKCINHLSYTLHAYLSNGLHTNEEIKNNFRPIENMYVLTGYSSKDYVADTSASLNFIPQENIFHLNTISYLKAKLKNRNNLVNSVLFIDEARLVVEQGQTIDKFLQECEIDDVCIKKFNILIFYIDATPDALMEIVKGSSILNSTNISNGDDDDIIADENGITYSLYMEPGPGYKGINFWINKGWLKDNYEEHNISTTQGLNNIFQRIKYNIENNKNCVLRIKDPKTKARFVEKCNKENFDVVYYDNRHKDEWTSRTEFPQDFDEAIGKKYNDAKIFILDSKFTCSKRLTLTPNIGLIYEHASKDPKDTITTQGLLARFFSYPDITNCNPEAYTLYEPWKRYQYFINRNGMELHPETISRYLRHVGDNTLILVENKKFAYQELLDDDNRISRNEHDVNGKKWLNKNIIWSGTSCRKLNNKQEINDQVIIPDKFTNPLGNPTIDNYMEIYNTEQELTNRKNQIGLSITTHEDSQFYSLEDAKGKGRHNPTSNLPFTNCLNDEDREKMIIEKNGVARIYKVNVSDGSIKYGLRWMLKI